MHINYAFTFIFSFSILFISFNLTLRPNVSFEIELFFTIKKRYKMVNSSMDNSMLKIDGIKYKL